MLFLQTVVAEHWPSRIAVILYLQTCLCSNGRLNNIYVSTLLMCYQILLYPTVNVILSYFYPL